MHRGFADKKRRHINLHGSQVKNVLPEYFAESYPKFITLLEKYYEWQDENNSTELLNHLFANRDINETDITLLTYIEDELLLGDAYFKGFGDTDAELRAAANFSNTLFRSKGTKFAIEWFFRSFYGLDVEVTYTKENVFKIGETSSTIGYESLKYLTDDKLYQTWALLVKSGVAISKWNQIFKLFVHPAGMYLGGEVSILSSVKEAINLMEDSVVSTRTSATYTVTPTLSSRNESQTFEINVDATNLRSNFGQGYYYIENISTSDNDFDTFVDSSNPELIYFDSVSSGLARATFTIDPKLDADELEGTEQFKVIVLDDEREKVGETTLTLTDRISTYRLLANTFSPTEGDTIQFAVQCLNPPAPSNTLFWYVNHGTTTDADFVTAPPTSGSPMPITIEDDSGRFSLATKVDAVTDTETFDVVIKNASGVIKDTGTITLNDKIPTFDVTVNDITEGSPLNITLQNEASSVGEIVNWGLTGAAASDTRFSETSGSFVITGTNDTYTLTDVASSNVYQGTVSGTLTVTETTTLFTDNDTFNVTDKTPSYLISPSPEPVAEGDTVTFNITGTNIDSDVTYYYYVDHVTTNDSDFSVAPPSSGSRSAVTFVSNASSPSPTLTISSNADTSIEEFDFVLTDDSTGGDILATERVSIVPPSLTYSLTPSSTSINESSTVTFDFETNDAVADYYYWIEGTGITSSDFSSGYASNDSRGTLTTTASGVNAIGQVSLSLNPDKIREGTETFVVKVAKTTTSGSVVNSGTITVSDTSVQSYTVSVSDITEGELLNVDITANIGEPETLYIEVTGAGVTGRIVAPQLLLAVPTVFTSTSVTFNTTVNDDYQGDKTGTVTIAIGNFASSGGTAVASDTFIMSDATPSGLTLVTDAVSDTVNEGATINFTFDGNNLPAKTYYVWPTGLQPKETTQSSSSGTYFIYCDTTNLALGMETQSLGINGTITFISPGVGVDMSDALTTDISAGTVIQFAQPELFDDFVGSPYKTFTLFTGSPELGTFSLVTNTDDDLNNDTYTIGVYDTPTGTLLKSREINITDTTPNVAALITNKPSTIRTRYSQPEVQSGVKFQPNGQIYATEPNQTIYTNFIGNWLEDISALPGSASDYEVKAEVNFELGIGTKSGSFGTWLPLTSDVSWVATVEDPQGSFSMGLTITVREVSAPGVAAVPPNNDSWTVSIIAEETYSTIIEGGESPLIDTGDR